MTDNPALSIGAIAGGPGTDPRWRNAVMALMRRVSDGGGSLDSPLHVNVVFQIPGSNLEPEFKGLRTSKFSKKENALMIQVGLSPEDPEHPDKELRPLLLTAIELAGQLVETEDSSKGL